MRDNKIIRVALVGNPNSGKSTIFNNLTGARQHVGNYPGVTVERYEGKCFYQDHEIELVDLPGTYSLTPYSEEERVTAQFLIEQHPDVVVNVIDASNLERNLYLTMLLQQMKVPLIVVLNMVDMAKLGGISIDTKILSTILDAPIIESIGSKSVGMDDILDALVQLADKQTETCEIQAIAETDTISTAAKRYEKIADICTQSVRSSIVSEKSRSDKLDSILTNRFWGIPIFLLLMYLVFQMTFTLGAYPMEWIESGFAWLGDVVNGFWPEGSESLLRSLLVDGVIGGVGGVIVFLPNILLLFLGIAILEDSGYMARAAFLTDSFMHRIGLHGKSFIPMLIGFGCSVPAIMVTRTLPSRKERLITMFIIPLMSCGARLPIYTLIIPVFFPLQWQAPLLWMLYCLGIILAIIIAKILSVFVIKEEESPFILELPPYHFPTFRTVGIHALERGWLYLKKAGTVILGISIVLWGLTTFPRLSEQDISKFDAQRETIVQSSLPEEEKQIQVQSVDDLQSETQLVGSYAGRLGKTIEPLLKPMGFDWKIGTALVGAFAAKEVFVAQMGIVYKVGEADEESEPLRETIKSNYPPLVGLCIMIFCLIGTPCMATVAVMARECNSWKWAISQWLFLTVLAWVITTIVYQVGVVYFYTMTT